METRGVTDRELKQLLRDHWVWLQEQEPRVAIAAGDRNAVWRFGLRSPSALGERRSEAAALLERAEALSTAGLDVEDLEHHGLLVRHLEGVVDEIACGFEQWRVVPQANPLMRANNLATIRELHIVWSDRAVAQVEHVARDVDESVKNLRLGLAKGLVSDRESIELVIEQLDEELAQDVSAWTMTTVARDPHPAWSALQIADFTRDMDLAAEEHARPALQRYRDFLADELLPAARESGSPGLAGLTLGERCYAERLAWYTSLELDPGELEAQGRAALADLGAELVALAGPRLGTTDVPSTLERLSTDDALYFTSEEGVEAAAKAAVKRAWKALPAWVGKRPKVRVTVEPLPAFYAERASAGLYVGPGRDGDVGRYMVNTSRPATRPIFEAEPLAFHEAVPGHHLQRTLAKKGVPGFRRFTGYSPFIEGWALYAEELALEMGLYTGDFDRVGQLSMAMLRAARLVVDTGLHAGGWSREEAQAFLLANTALTAEEAEVQVERYLARPGQAVSYWVGAAEIRALREQAEAAMGDRFDIVGFHRLVLEAGEITVEMLRERVGRWTGG